MAKPQKQSSVADLTEQFRSSSAAVLTEYRGLTVAQLKQLRRSLGSTVTYAVVKNTLTKIAAREAGVSGLDEMLAGPSAIAFVSGDPVEAAKGIKDFAKENPSLIIKGGVVDGAVLSAAEISRLADLESREVLLSKLAGAMKAKQSQAAALLAAPLGKAARALGALQAKLESAPAASVPADVPASAPADVPPTPEPASEPEAAATEPAADAEPSEAPAAETAE